MTKTPNDPRAWRISARFRHARRFDRIVLRTRMTGIVASKTGREDSFCTWNSIKHCRPRQDFSVVMDSVFCPFPDFIRFLEAITMQVQECAFDWEAEGPSGRMQWRRRKLNRDGVLTISWHSEFSDREHDFSYELLLDTRHTVRMLYTAFRRFVESPEYDPIRYEKLTIGEAIELVLSDATLDDVARCLASMNRLNGARFLDSLDFVHWRRNIESDQHRVTGTLDSFLLMAQDGELHGLPENPSQQDPFRGGLLGKPSWLDSAWDDWDYEKRMNYLTGKLFQWEKSCWYGGRLRQLRSPRIEEWLASEPSVKMHRPEILQEES